MNFSFPVLAFISFVCLRLESDFKITEIMSILFMSVLRITALILVCDDQQLYQDILFIQITCFFPDSVLLHKNLGNGYKGFFGKAGIK